MPRVARAPAIPPPPPLPALSLVLTGQVYLVSVKKGRLLTKSAIFDSSLGKKGETTNTQTSVGKHFGPVMFTGLRFFYVGKQKGLVLFTEIFLNYRPSGIWGSYVDSPHLKPPTIHARGRFPGRSLLPTGDRPRQRPFSRLVNVWSGTGWCKATCHPRLGGACEAIGLVRIAQAGVAGAAPSRDAKRAGTTAAQRPGAAATARPGCGELNPKGSPPRPAVTGASQGSK